MIDFGALGSLGELVGGIAVVASLIYLASQVRQGTQATKLANHHQALSLFAHVADWTVRDREVADLFRKGLLDFAALSDTDRFRFSQLMTHLFLLYNYQRESHEAGLLERDFFAVWEQSIAAFLKMPGGAAWWAGGKVLFHPAAVARLDGAIGRTPPMNEVWTDVWKES